MQLNRKVVLGIAALGMGAAWGAASASTTVFWTNNNATAEATSAWGEPANWQNADGELLTVAPTNAADSFEVVLPPIVGSRNGSYVHTTNGFVKTITTGGLAGSDAGACLAEGSVNPSIAKIRGEDERDTYRYVIQHTMTTSGTRHGVERAFTIYDPNDFYGLWTTAAARAGYVLLADALHVPALRALDTEDRPFVTVPDAGTTAEINSLRAGGQLVKRGEGTLRVCAAEDEKSHYEVTAGTLELGGSDEAALLENLFAEALLHLDASVAATLVKSNDLGRTWIARWNDVRSPETNAAYVAWVYGNPGGTDAHYFYAFARSAFLSPATSPTGLPLVDFGDNADMAGADPDVTYCHLVLSSRFTNVKEAAYAVQTPKGPSSATVLGDLNSYDWVSEGNAFFVTTYGTYKVCKGAFWLDGVYRTIQELNARAKTNGDDVKEMMVMHAAPGVDTTVGALGTDRRYCNRSGGSRLGEVLLFDRTLTMAERAALDRYLVRKWKTGEGVRDAASVDLAAHAALSVGEDSLVRVGSVTSTNALVRKTGAGTLALDGVAPAGAALAVEDGAVRFTDARVPTNAPADGAYVWLDSTKADTFTAGTVEGSPLDHVSAWRDCRADSSIVATAASRSGTNLPWRVVDGLSGGRAVVDLGYGQTKEGNQCYFTLPTWEAPTTEDTYAGFMVLRRTDIGTGRNFFGSSSLEMMRSARSLLTSSYVQRFSPAALWRIDGCAADPWIKQPRLDQTNEFILVAFRTERPLTVNAIAKDRKGQGQDHGCGSCQVGEFITYHRKLTLDEFHQTEAYLMAKWLGKTHPVNATGVGPTTFGADVPATLDVDRDFVFDTLDGGNGTLVKSGAGKATATLVDTSVGAAGILVEEGTLDLTCAPTFDGEALFHFDASDLAGMTYEVSEDGATTNVTQLLDARRNGVSAASAYSMVLSKYFTGYYTNTFVAHPTLRTVTTAAGVTRPALDFGGKRNCSAGGASDSATLAFRAAGVTTGYSNFDNVREIFLVAAQKGAIYNNFVGGINSGAFTDMNLRLTPNDSNYMRSEDALVNTSYTYPGLASNNSARVDGVTGAATKLTLKEADGFKLIELVPGGNTRASGYAVDRNCNAGGSCLCEILAFSRELTDAERARLRAALRTKWFGEAKAPYAVEEIALAPGASFSFAGAPLQVDAITVESDEAVAPGVYTLLTADEGLAPGTTPEINLDLPRGLGATTWFDGNVLKANVYRKGTVLLMR